MSCCRFWGTLAMCSYLNLWNGYRSCKDLPSDLQGRFCQDPFQLLFFSSSFHIFPCNIQITSEFSNWIKFSLCFLFSLFGFRVKKQLKNLQNFKLVCPGSQEDKAQPGMHQTQWNQLGKREHDPIVSRVGKTSPWPLNAILGPTI